MIWRNFILIKNLSPQETLLGAIRILLSFATIIFLLTILLAPSLNNSFYLSRINCAHLDVSEGLYKSLRNSVSSTSGILSDSSSQYRPSGNSLTNSEISLLSQYAESQVAGAPQYCITSLWHWCYGNYDTVQKQDKYGDMKSFKEHEVLTCNDKKKYVFDYKMELKEIGLDSILAYAYQESSDTNDTGYDTLVNSRNRAFKYAINALIFTGCAQFLLFILTFVIYSNRDGASNLSKIPKWLLHITGLVSAASSVSMLIGSAIITRLINLTKREISNKLGDFGVSYHVGTKWFALMWTCCSLAILSSASWCLPLWCANPEESKYFEREPGYSQFKRLSSRPDPEPILENNQDIDNYEVEMRKLGESLSKKSTVRRFNTLKSNDAQPTIQEEIYDGYDSSASISRTPSDRVNPFENRRSYLADEELVLLNNQMFTIDK